MGDSGAILNLVFVVGIGEVTDILLGFSTLFLKTILSNATFVILNEPLGILRVLSIQVITQFSFINMSLYLSETV